MAQDEDNGRLVVAREALINAPDFLRSIVETTAQSARRELAAFPAELVAASTSRARMAAVAETARGLAAGQLS